MLTGLPTHLKPVMVTTATAMTPKKIEVPKPNSENVNPVQATANPV